MIGVDVIGQIRRAYFEQGRPIKEIVRTFSVSRATVRKVVGSQADRPPLSDPIVMLGKRIPISAREASKGSQKRDQTQFSRRCCQLSLR